MNSTLRLIALITLMALSACANKRPLELPGHEKHHPPKVINQDDSDDDSDTDTSTPKTITKQGTKN